MRPQTQAVLFVQEPFLSFVPPSTLNPCDTATSHTWHVSLHKLCPQANQYVTFNWTRFTNNRINKPPPLPAAMPKHRPAIPISQASSFSYVSPPPPSGSTEPLQTPPPPSTASTFVTSINSFFDGEEAAEWECFPFSHSFAEFHAICNTAEWVVPPTATIELFRLSSTEMVRDECIYPFALSLLTISALLLQPLTTPSRPFSRALQSQTQCYESRIWCRATRRTIIAQSRCR